MRSVMLALLAGLVAIQSATAIYVEGGAPPEPDPWVDLVAEYRDSDCPDDPAPCLVIVNGTVWDLRAGSHVNLTVTNQLDRDVSVQAMTDGHHDDPWDNETGNFSSVRRELLVQAAFEAGENRTIAFEIPGDARGLKLIVLEDDEATSEVWQDLQVYYLAASGEPVDDEGQGNLDDVPADGGESEASGDDGKGAPGLPIVLGLAALAFVAGVRRQE